MSANFIQIQGRTYRTKTFDEFSFGDFRRIALNAERAAGQRADEEFYRMMRAMIVVLSPLAAHDASKWSNSELVNATPAVLARLGEIMVECGEMLQRFSASFNALRVRLFPPNPEKTQ